MKNDQSHECHNDTKCKDPALTRETDVGRSALSKTEMALLRYLAQNRKTCARATLLRDVLGYQPRTDTHALETHVWRIRRKIECVPKRPRILVTEQGGYQLVIDPAVTGTKAWTVFCQQVGLPV